MRISDWSSDVCSSDLRPHRAQPARPAAVGSGAAGRAHRPQPRRTPGPGRAPGPSRENPPDMNAAFLATAPRWRDALPTEYAGLVETLEPLFTCIELPLTPPWLIASITPQRHRAALT